MPEDGATRRTPASTYRLQLHAGFTFDDATPSALRDTVLWAQRCYHDPVLWTQLALNGMRQDWSWKHSAEMYCEVYRRA